MSTQLILLGVACCFRKIESSTMVRDSFPDNAGNRYCKVCKQGSDVSLECIGMSIAWCLFCLSIIGGAILRHCGLCAAHPVMIKIVSKRLLIRWLMFN